MTVYLHIEQAEIHFHYNREGRAGYVPSLEDKMLYLDECDDLVTRESRACALTEVMGDPDGDDSWTEIW